MDNDNEEPLYLPTEKAYKMLNARRFGWMPTPEALAAAIAEREAKEPKGGQQ